MDRSLARSLTCWFAVACAVLVARPTGAQVPRQSDLTLDDMDPDFEITLAHLYMDARTGMRTPWGRLVLDPFPGGHAPGSV